MKIANNILETIGNTPMVKLNAITRGMEATVLAKVEYFNPGSSVKDRMALKMVEDAEALGANAIVGMSFTTSVMAQGSAELMAYGTAVIIED